MVPPPGTSTKPLAKSHRGGWIGEQVGAFAFREGAPSHERRGKITQTASRLSSISAIVLTPHSPIVVSISLAMMSSALATPACPPAPRP
jgi:hypothetical protein